MNQQINIEAFKNKDTREFEKIVDLFNAQLNYFALKLLKRGPEAEEVALDSLQKLFERCANFETLEQIKAFLYITVRNDCLNNLKSKKRQSKREKELACFQMDQENMVELQSIEADLLRRLIKAVELLPDSCRQIFKLYLFNGLSRHEIAKELNKKISNVNTQLHNARKTLRKLL